MSGWMLRPGSAEALHEGCQCPVLDNAHGRGYKGGVRDPRTGETIYVYNMSCPMHGEHAEKLCAPESGATDE